MKSKWNCTKTYQRISNGSFSCCEFFSRAGKNLLLYSLYCVLEYTKTQQNKNQNSMQHKNILNHNNPQCFHSFELKPKQEKKLFMRFSLTAKLRVFAQQARVHHQGNNTFFQNEHNSSDRTNR